MTVDMEAIIQKPKAELHMHLEGSLEPAMLLNLANKNGVMLEHKTLDEIKSAYHFNNLQDFLDLYYQGMSVLQTEADFYDLTYAYLQKAKQNNVVHAEMFIDPQAHVSRGIELSTIFDGITRAIKQAESQLAVSGSLIVCFLRHLPEIDALHLFERLMAFRKHFIGIGLDSSEIGNPPRKFKQLFDKARHEKLRLVAHAGEEGPAEYVWEALDILGVERIDHGNAVLKDDALMRRIENDGIALTMCPLSNKSLKIISTLTEHPAKQLLNRGIKVTINSDDPAYFGGYINQNYHELICALDLNVQEVSQLIENSLSSKFISEMDH